MEKNLENWREHITYTDAKKCIRENIHSLARDYIAIGFYLRRVRDDELFLEDGYKSIHDFAYTEFGMRKSTVNHCIRINAEFSEGGNSPVIDARYKEFGKTQLQELLYVPEDKRDEVTPDMTVAEIREIHKPERQDTEPKESEVQRLNVEPDGNRLERLINEPEKNVKSVREKNGKDFHGEETPEVPGTQSAITAPEPLHFTAGPVTADNYYGATYAEIVERYLETEYRSASEERVAVVVNWGIFIALRRPMVTEFYKADRLLFDVENERLEREYQAMFEEENAGTFPEILESPMNPAAQDKEVHEEMGGAQEEVSDPEPDVEDAEYQEWHTEITVRDLLHRKQRELDEWTETMGDDDWTAVPGIVELGIIVRALEFLAGQQDSQEEPETEKEVSESVPKVDVEEVMAAVAKSRWVGKKALDDIRQCVEPLFRREDISTEPDGRDTETLDEMSWVKEQPPLPVLKNNEQRKEWLRKYQEWGLWYEDRNIGAKYYRYCFENGAELIVEEYQSHSEYAGDYIASYFHLVGGPKVSLKNGISRWQRHERYNKFPNSESELVEFLKFIQKGDK